MPETTKKKVLIVEDDALLLVTLLHQFEAAGYEVLTAHNGLMGKAAFYKSNPDIVVSDVMMPNKNGVEMIEEINAEHPDNKTPFIFLSNADNMNYVGRAMKNDAVGYFLKSDRHVDSIVTLVDEKLGVKR
jgi:DNA-binding response OmpR family regulator